MSKIVPEYVETRRQKEEKVGVMDRQDRGPVTPINNKPQFGVNNLEPTKRLSLVRTVKNR